MTSNESRPRQEESVGVLQLTALPSGEWLLAGRLSVQDRPGELAEVTSAIAGQQATIERFFYNRSQEAHVVTIATRVPAGEGVGRLATELREKGRLEPPPNEPDDAIAITDPAGLLRVKVTLQPRPGSLAAFAGVLKVHRASVIYLAYDGKNSPGLAEMAMATASPEEVSALLRDLNEQGYHYHVDWQGAEGGPMGDVIGLSVVERFLFDLRAALPRKRLHELEELIRSSKDLQETLLRFTREAGGSDESMAASEIFTKILELATASVSKTGPGFLLRLTGPLELSEQVSLYMLACPTGANSYLLRTEEGYTLIDSSYGLYYADAKKALAGHGIDVSRIRSALFTHADADHAGWAERLEEEFGTAVYIHPDSLGIFRHENRAYGSGTRLAALNADFTKLINRFTDLRPPREPRPFPPADGQAGEFKVIGRFPVGDIELLALASHGGHVPGQVFFYARREGLLFSGDYLIDFASLSDREKSTLSIPRFLMTSTNADARMFGREMRKLAALMLETHTNIQAAGRLARVFPGHGGFYRVDEAYAMLQNLVQQAER